MFILGAVEKQKLVYIPNRDAEARLTISSPLEANKSNTLVYHMVGIDVAFDNPIFACLEIDYEVNNKLIIYSQLVSVEMQFITHFVNFDFFFSKYLDF